MPDLRKIDPNIPQPLENAVLKATAKDPDQRYQSVKEMCADLTTCLMPERADEPKFIPTPINDLEETRVMEPLDETSDKSAMGANKPQKLSRKHKIILLASIVPLVLVLFLIAMVIKSNQETTVPDLFNLTVKQANVMLKSSNLAVGDISKENDDDVDAGHVVKSIPTKGLKLKNGAKVNLVVSLGATYYKMPKLVGKDYEDVSDNLKKRGFKVKIDYKATNQYEAGVIIKQSIPSGKKVVTKNKSLTLTIAKTKTVKPKVIKVRDLTGYNLKSIQDYASETGLTLSTSNQYSDDIEEGLLVSQTPTANSTISQGGTLTVVMSKGPDPDKSTTSDKDSNGNSNSSNSNSGSSSSTNTVNKDITIPYDASGNNSVTIYISDATHNINTAYKTMTITADTPVTLSFNLKDGQTGSYVVERDNKTVLGGSVNG